MSPHLVPPSLAERVERLASYASEAADVARAHGRIRDARHLQHLSTSLAPIVAAVEELQRQRDAFARDRVQLAMLAADEAQFATPLGLWEAQAVRDSILSARGTATNGGAHA